MALGSIHRQDGYGAFKRREHCEVCYVWEHKVGTWRATYDDGTKRFFCDTHISHALAGSSPAPAAMTTSSAP
jgi:hypothetical protein